MSFRSLRQLVAIVSLVAVGMGSADGCSLIPLGGYPTFEELVDKTEQIFLAEFQCIETDGFSCWFNVVETIKGDSNESLNPRYWMRHVYRALSENNLDPPNDFEGHSSQAFWDRKAVRSAWPGGSCTPRFTFLPNEQYLIFLDSPSSLYAAELIRSSDDAWLNFVKERVKYSHNKPLQQSLDPAEPFAVAKPTSASSAAALSRYMP